MQKTTIPTYITTVFTETTILDRVTDELKAGRIARSLDELFDDLMARRAKDPAAWPEFARQCRNHELRQFMHADPLTYRAFSKPRGYAGDAVMMDYVYGMGAAEEVARTATPLGRDIFTYIGERPSARAVRFRRALIAAMLDSAARREDPRALAIAAGHLREVELSRAAREGKFSEFVAFDRDEASLTVIAHDYAHFGITPTLGSVRQILSGKVQLGQYDFVYAAGLFDYLNAPVAAALTRRMFEAVRSGGTMLIPNFLTGIRDAGYMEAFMDWHLIYRDHGGMGALAAALPADRIAHIDIFNDPDDTIAFLLATRK